MDEKIKIAVVDDHQLVRNGMINLINSVDNQFEVILEAENGKLFLDELELVSVKPEIVVLDISMPVMNGFETAKILREKYPDIKVLIISINEDEFSLVRMLKYDVKGYLGKDVETDELKMAIQKIHNGGYYYTDQMTKFLIGSLQYEHETQMVKKLTESEIVFLKLVCSEDTYGKIAQNMNSSLAYIEGYRDSVFEKLKITTRVGLVMFAIKSNLVKL